MYEVQSKLRNDDLREGWRPYPEGYTVLAEAMAGMGYEAEVNPHLRLFPDWKNASKRALTSGKRFAQPTPINRPHSQSG